MTNYKKGSIDPDTYQRRDIKRRVAKLEKQRGYDLKKIDSLAGELVLQRAALERLLNAFSPKLPPLGGDIKEWRRIMDFTGYAHSVKE